MPDYDHSHDHEQRTRTVARIAGPYLVATAATVFARLDTLHLLLPAFVSNAPIVLAVGCFTLMVGLTMLALHHHLDTIPAIAITLLAVLMSVRGAAMMIIPDVSTRYVGFIIGVPLFPIAGAIIILIVGLWLTYVGWIARPQTRVSAETHTETISHE